MTWCYIGASNIVQKEAATRMVLSLYGSLYFFYKICGAIIGSKVVLEDQIYMN